MCLAAASAGLDPDRTSFTAALRAVRRTMIAARISAGSSAHPTPEQTQQVLAAWHAAAA